MKYAISNGAATIGQIPLLPTTIGKISSTTVQCSLLLFHQHYKETSVVSNTIAKYITKYIFSLKLKGTGIVNWGLYFKTFNGPDLQIIVIS